MPTRQQQLEQARRQAERISRDLSTFKQAQDAGMNIDRQTTDVSEARRAVQQTKPVQEVGVISSNQGLQAVNEAKEKEAQLSPIQREDINKQIEQINQGTTALGKERGTELQQLEKLGEDSVTLVNPETEQELTLKGEANNPEKRSELEAQGFQIAEGTLSATEETPEIRQAQRELDQAEQELNSYRNKVSDMLISDSELQSELNSISTSFNLQQEEMQRINENRVQTIKTMGVRLGSRYTGGTGGVMGSIIAEEQRQGIARIAEIEAQKQAALAGAKRAAKEFNFQLYTNEINRAEEQQERKLEEVQQLREIQREREGELQKEVQQTYNDSLIAGAIESGYTNPVDIFAALGGSVSFDDIISITKELPEPEVEEQFTLGKGDIRYDAQGNVIAKGSGVGFGSPGLGGGRTTEIAPDGSAVSFPTNADLDAMTTTERDFVNKVIRQLPTKLKDSEQEKKDRMKEALFDYRRGRDIQSVIDEMNGFVVADDGDQALASYFRQLAVGSGVELGEISAAINNRNPEQAMTTIENAKLADADQYFSSTDEARNIISQINTIQRLVDNVPTDKLGAFDGRKFKMQRFAGLTDDEMIAVQNLETALQTLASPMRVTLIGTAGTEAEMAKITALQSEITDQPEIIKAKVGQFKNDVLGFHNQARSQRGLPTVGYDTLISNDKRLEMYKKQAEERVQAVYEDMSNTDLINRINNKATGKQPEVTTSDKSDEEFWDDF